MPAIFSPVSYDKRNTVRGRTARPRAGRSPLPITRYEAIHVDISPEAKKLLDAANAKKSPSAARGGFWGALAGVMVVAGLIGSVWMVREHHRKEAESAAALARWLNAGSGLGDAASRGDDLSYRAETTHIQREYERDMRELARMKAQTDRELEQLDRRGAEYRRQLESQESN